MYAAIQGVDVKESQSPHRRGDVPEVNIQPNVCGVYSISPQAWGCTDAFHRSFMTDQVETISPQAWGCTVIAVTKDEFWNLPTGVGMYRCLENGLAISPQAWGCTAAIPHRRGDVRDVTSTAHAHTRPGRIMYLFNSFAQSPHRRGDVPCFLPTDVPIDGRCLFVEISPQAWGCTVTRLQNPDRVMALKSPHRRGDVPNHMQK